MKIDAARRELPIPQVKCKIWEILDQVMDETLLCPILKKSHLRKSARKIRVHQVDQEYFHRKSVEKINIESWLEIKVLQESAM